MSQIRNQTVNVTNASPTVSGSGTSWLTDLSIGDLFIVDGTASSWFVGSVDSDTQVTLTSNYTGATATGITAHFTRDFTDLGFALINPQDQGVAAIETRNWKTADTMITAEGTPGTLNGLSDVTLSTPADTEVLQYDSGSGQWVNASLALTANLGDLGDVTIAGIADNDLLQYNSGTGDWENVTIAAAGLATSAQGALADTSVQPGDNVSDLTNDAGYIADITGENLGDLADVTITTLGTDELLFTQDGSNWINQTLAEAGIAAATHTHVEADITDLGTYLTDITGENLGDLADVTIAGPTSGDLLSFTGSVWEDKSYSELSISRYNTSETRSATINMADYVFQRPEVKDYSITHTAPSSSSGAITFDYSVGQSYKVTLTENITSITISNPPATGKYGEIIIQFTQGAGAYTVSGWAAAVKWAGGAVYSASAASGSIDKVTLSTIDGGTTWLANYSGGYL